MSKHVYDTTNAASTVNLAALPYNSFLHMQVLLNKPK